MKEIKLTLPEDDFTRPDAINAEKRKGTLAKLVSDTIDNGLKNVSFKTYGERETKRSLTDTVCKTANSAFEDTRRRVDAVVMDYLLEHDGQAGSYPDYMGNSILSYNQVETACSLRFIYFGEDFEVTVPERDKFVIDRKSKELVYRDCYIPEDMKEYAELEKEIECHPESLKLKKLRKLGDLEVDHPALYLGFLLILLLLVGSSLLCLIWEMAAGAMTDGPLKAFVEGPLASLSPDGLTGLLRSGVSLLLMPAEICADIGEWGFTLTILSVVFIAFLMGISRQSGILKAKKALKPLERKLKKLEPENERWKAHCREISEQWHKAWFQWCREHKEDEVSLSDLY